MGELSVLRAVGLAGVSELGAVARATGMGADDARQQLEADEASGLVTATPRELAASAAAMVPRLAPYGARFDDATLHLERGDEKYLVSVTVDSYHTVWFQFHEELIVLAGRTRAEGAAEGRG